MKYNLVPVEVNEKTHFILDKRANHIFKTDRIITPNHIFRRINFIALSDDDIKYGDTVYCSLIKQIFICQATITDTMRKIIFSTNQIESLPTIPESFHSEIHDMYNNNQYIIIDIVMNSTCPDCGVSIQEDCLSPEKCQTGTLHFLQEPRITNDNEVITTERPHVNNAMKVDLSQFKSKPITLEFPFHTDYKKIIRYTHEEVEELCKRAMVFGHDENTSGKSISKINHEEWISKNLKK